MSYIRCQVSVDEPEIIHVTDQSSSNLDRPITVSIGSDPTESTLHLSRIAAQELLVQLANTLGREVHDDARCFPF